MKQARGLLSAALWLLALCAGLSAASCAARPRQPHSGHWRCHLEPDISSDGGKRVYGVQLKCTQDANFTP